MHSRRVSDMHKYAIGVPNLPIAPKIDDCPICLKVKLHKANKSTSSTLKATQCNQGISIDFGFVVQSSKGSERVRCLSGLDGETCYVLLRDHFSNTLFGTALRSKAPPIEWLTRWLATKGAGPTVDSKYGRVDLGGELGRCQEVLDLFTQVGYAVEPTAPNSSHQNGSVERPHRDLENSIRAMLSGASLASRFWPYAFYHFLRLHNMTIHGDQVKTPYELCSSRKPDLSRLCTFGCRVYVKPPRPRRPAKTEIEARTGIFLGYAQTLNNLLYFDLESHEV
jgi:hypothetical protein